MHGRQDEVKDMEPPQVMYLHWFFEILGVQSDSFILIKRVTVFHLVAKLRGGKETLSSLIFLFNWNLK